MSSAKIDAYTGTDNLEEMANAKNYNAYLVNLIIQGQSHTAELVDFGAGIGIYAQMLLDKGFRVRCIEPDAALADKLSAAGLSVNDSIGQLNGIEFLYSLNVLEHIEDDFSTVCEIFDHLNVGGRVFVYVPAFMVLYTNMDRKVGHFRRYTKKQIVVLFERAGFTLDEARYADSLGFLVTLMFKWFGNSRGDLNPMALKIYDRIIFPISRVCDLMLSPFFGKNVMIRAHKRRE
jgi:hypothetical protein